MGWRDRSNAFWRDQTGTATVEFVIVFPMFMIIFIAMYESSMLLTRQVLLERSLDLVVRDLRINSDGSVITAEELRSQICDNTLLLSQCESGLILELTEIPTTYATPDADAPCVNRAEDISPNAAWNLGGRDQLMLIRACYASEQMLAISGVGMRLARDASGSALMMASSIFVNEPR